MCLHGRELYLGRVEKGGKGVRGKKREDRKEGRTEEKRKRKGSVQEGERARTGSGC